MGVRMSCEMAVMSSVLASQARFSLPSCVMTDCRISSMEAASALTSSDPGAAMLR